MKIYVLALMACGLLLLSTCKAKKKPSALHKGDSAPNFKLLDETGTLRTLQEFRGKKVVLYFYPKDDTPGCTAQACSFRDTASTYAKNDIVVLGVSYDSPESHAEFKAKHHLPFTLLSDTTTQVAQKYGAYGRIPIVNRYAPNRITFLINEQGIIVAKLENIDVATYAETILKIFGITYK